MTLLCRRMPGEPMRIMPLVGAVAGLMYGKDALPTAWLNNHEKDIVTRILKQLTKVVSLFAQHLKIKYHEGVLSFW